ncbi:MAG: hypothetical protein O3A14_02010 [Cyanobacteria bacterium]|nr:hypothetical protein [Cyanobacteriota bacterium]
MADNLENRFLLELRKRQQRQRYHRAQQVSLAGIALAATLGAAHIKFKQSGPFLESNLSAGFWGLVTVALGAAIAGCWLGYRHRLRTSTPPTAKRLQPPWPFLKTPYVWLGVVGLLCALAWYRPAIHQDPLETITAKLTYNPQPPEVASPWPWPDQPRLHPAIVAFPVEAETSISTVAAYIAAQEADPYLRVKAIHDYVISRVTYDRSVLAGGVRPEQDAETVFRTHQALCEGYAKLFQSLGEAMGLNVAYVTGNVRRDFAPVEVIPPSLRYVTSDYDWTYHAWNGVKLEGNWYLVDTTWDDVDQADPYGYQADYLMVPPEVMVLSHLPQQQGWQLLKKPIRFREFEQQPILTPQFFSDRLQLQAPTRYRNEVEVEAEMRIQSPENYEPALTAGFIPVADRSFSLWDFLGVNPSEASSRPGLNPCQTLTASPGQHHLTCILPQQGTYQIFLFSEGETIDPIGQLQFQAV